MGYALRIACPTRSQNDQQREPVTKKNARRTRCRVRGGNATNTTDANHYPPQPTHGWRSVKNRHSAGRRSVAGAVNGDSGRWRCWQNDG